jgi:hydrogenase nickel incorporation protein HypA/HybF
MHEYALAEAVVDAAVQTARQERIVKIETIVVRVGELQRIKPDIFEFALNEIVRRATPGLSDARFEVTVEPARMRCRACGAEFSMSDASGGVDADEAEAIHFVPELSHAFMRCPSCQSPDFEIVSGRGVSLASLEGETED